MKKLAITACLLAVLLSGCSLFTEEIIPPAPTQPTVSVEELRQQYTGYGFGALETEEEQRLYAAVDEAANKPKSEEFFGGAFTEEKRVTEVIELYKNDHPEVFWIDEAEPYYYAKTDAGMTMQLHFKLEGADLQAAQQALENAVQAAVANAPAEGSAYDKELYAHDYLIDNCFYDEEAVELHKSDQVRSNEQNAYGALVEGRAVCEGYARAFQILCGRLDIPCWVVQGRAENFDDEADVNHIWNCVQLDGDWYYVDVTWDDYEDAPAAADRYYYFNLTTAELEKDHVISPLYSETDDESVWCNGFIPTCTATAYFYFTLNAMPIDDLDADGYAAYLANAAANNASCCCYLVSENADFETVFDDMVQGYAYDWVTSANEINNYTPQISTSCKLSGNEVRRVVTLILNYES